jgi:hypothetical protein
MKSDIKETNITEALRSIASVMKQKVIVFLISDFMDSDYIQNLKIVARKHDITGVRIYDKNEVQIPSLGVVQMVD